MAMLPQINSSIEWKQNTIHLQKEKLNNRGANPKQGQNGLGWSGTKTNWNKGELL